jgi:predicted component of type VI protein secretion system
MSFDLSGIDGLRGFHAQSTRPASAAGSAGDFAGAIDAAMRSDRFEAIPASPPPHLRAEMLAAQRAVEDMHARGRELHFEMTDGRLRIEMRDLDGNVLREIPGHEALEIASGRITE